MDCVALLDDRAATSARPSSRLYEGFEREHRCVDPAQLAAVWAQVDADLRSGLHAVLLADYEWGTKLLKAGVRPGSEAAALRVLMFRTLKRLSRDEVDAWLADRDASAADEAAGVMDLRPSVERSEFTQAIAAIHAAIAAGETYQVNYTYRIDGAAFGSPIALYRRLRARQPVEYGAFIVLPDGAPVTHVLSLSPELFLRHEAGRLTARPMKGTAARVAAPESDSESARLLAIDIKNRAENLMIVDLLRNDLSMVCEPGTVTVPELMAVESYASVHQLVSTVRGRLRDGVGTVEALRALFPDGSMTGAPKLRTMRIIEDVEDSPRGVYAGAFGWVGADGRADLGVVIRTLVATSAAGGWAYTLGTGGGITVRSDVDEEYAETRWKAERLLGVLDG
jgi:para-aminobenzoate synthetase/4-amino-4-deoxychorismate lyase